MKKSGSFKIVDLCIVFYAAIIILTALAGCSSSPVESSTDSESHDSNEQIMLAFLEALRDNPDDAVSFCHFEDDFERQAYEQSNKQIVSYEVLDVVALSSNLSVYKLHITQDWREIPERYYFVGSINGKAYVMNNINNVPESMLTELSEDDIIRYTPDNLVPRNSDVDAPN